MFVVCQNCGAGIKVGSTFNFTDGMCEECLTMGQWATVDEDDIDLAVPENLLPDTVKSQGAEEIFTPESIGGLIDAVNDAVSLCEMDATTVKGRAVIKSVAAKVSKAKTYIDRIGKDKVAVWKNQAKEVDGQRKRFRDAMDELRDETRKPVTEFEEAEKAKKEAEALQYQIDLDHDAALAENDLFNREREIRLKEEAAAKLEEERKAKEAAELAEKQRKAREAEIAAEAKKEAEEAQKRAEEAAKRAEEEKVEAAKQAELAKIEAEKQAEIDKQVAIQRAKDEAEAEAKRKEQERIAKKEAKKAAADKLAENKKHRAKVKKEACAAMAKHTSTEDLFDAIASGNVPRVGVNW